jgi:hypothetical protein
MGVPYGWFLHKNFSREEVLAFVATVPNAGITEHLDGTWVDVYLADQAVKVEPADVEDLVDLLERGSGSYSYDVASALQLAKCVAIELPKGVTLLRGTRFGDYRCVDLAQTLANAQGMLEDGCSDADADDLRALCKSLSRALCESGPAVSGVAAASKIAGRRRRTGPRSPHRRRDRRVAIQTSASSSSGSSSQAPTHPGT